MEENINNTDNNKEGNSYGVHFLLSHSYLVFLASVILGVVFDIIIPSDIFSGDYYQQVGLICIFLGSIIIFWAQRTSGSYKDNSLSDSFFFRGPYKFSRHPTHFGLFIMTLGLAFIINSLFSVIFTIVAHFLTKFFFVKKQEEILERKYGETYLKYKRRVKNWI
jgi:protein-S-isoprenylcysteine O-methyltransferase Ste14